MDLTLVLLAAGMGSRYGGLKQLDPIGPEGQTLMDYSIRYAAAAGFTRVVFVIRRDFAEAFAANILPRYDFIETAVAFQELTDLPEGCALTCERTKPWGTAHAILSARRSVTTPFLAINADDFYGADSFAKMAEFLRETELVVEGGVLRCALAGYALENTLSEHGGVSRGVCQVSAAGKLEVVEECTEIQRGGEGELAGVDPRGAWRSFTGAELVSMNFWGFPAEIFPALGELFAEFMQTGGLENPRSEFYIPTAVSRLIECQRAIVSVLPTSAKWFGVTYQADRPTVARALAALPPRQT
jgi:hypothetical protein